jgi:hypothetical protein
MAEVPTTSVQFQLVPGQETPDGLHLYANHAAVTATPHDISIHLGAFAIPALTAPPASTVDVPVRPVALVTIPISIAEPLAQLLLTQLSAWESNFSKGSHAPAIEPQGGEEAS